jgi:hypothetical protein
MMRRYLRYLRIAFSATCLIAWVLVIALWVRSYWWYDSIWHPEKGWLPNGYTSTLGDLSVHWDSEPGGPRWRVYNQANENSWRREISDRSWIKYRFHWNITGGCDSIGCPHWFACSVLAAIATLLWIPWSRGFSLRTLIIATTVVCVALGLAVYAVRE